MKALRPLLLQGLVALTVGMSSAGAQAGNQQYEPLAASVQAALPALLEGEVVAVSLAGVTTSRGCALQLVRSGEGWQLSGYSTAVPLASQARHALLVAQAEDGTRLVWLDLQAAGVTLTPGQSQHHQALADVQCAAVALGADAVLPAAAFAWLASMQVHRRPAGEPAVTGARGPRILGALYPA